MGLAEMLDAPVILVGDIDRGGVFAQLLGTIMLVSDDERARIKGLVINKFRGDKTILDPGVEMLTERAEIPVDSTRNTRLQPCWRVSLKGKTPITKTNRISNGILQNSWWIVPAKA